MRRFLLSLVVFLLFFISVIPQAYAQNLILNPSFETSSSVDNWNEYPGTATLTTSNTAKTGNFSASLNKTNNKLGSIYLYQDVDVDTSQYYSLSGYVLKNSSNFDHILLRISWRDSSLAQISVTDSDELTIDSSNFQVLSISSVQPPQNALKARIELLANISTANPQNPALFDDIEFSEVSPPTQVPSTPTPKPSPTLTPTPTPTPNSTPNPTINPTIKPTLKTTVKPTISPTKISFKTSSPRASVAGNFTISPNPSPSVLQSKSNSSDLIVKLLLVFGGILLLVSFLFFLPKILENFFNKDKL